MDGGSASDVGVEAFEEVSLFKTATGMGTGPLKGMAVGSGPETRCR